MVHPSRLPAKHGFTIVELLIVVVVIAILAAITIVSYNGITKNATNSGIQSTLSSAAGKIEIYKVNDPASLYPASLASAGLTLVDGDGTLYVYTTSVDSTQYCLASSKSGRTYFISSATPTPRAGKCNSAVGIPGTGDVATDGASIGPGVAKFTPSTLPGAAAGFTIGSSYDDGNANLQLGFAFYAPPGTIVKGVRFYSTDANNTLGVALYKETVGIVASNQSGGVTGAVGWVQRDFDTPFTVNSNDEYSALVVLSKRKYTAKSGITWGNNGGGTVTPSYSHYFYDDSSNNFAESFAKLPSWPANRNSSSNWFGIDVVTN